MSFPSFSQTLITTCSLVDEHKVGWSEWSAYTPCNSRCMKYRQRVCFSSRSHCPGADSHGIKTDRRKCTEEECYGKSKIIQVINLLIFISGGSGRMLTAHLLVVLKSLGFLTRSISRSLFQALSRWGRTASAGRARKN